MKNIEILEKAKERYTGKIDIKIQNTSAYFDLNLTENKYFAEIEFDDDGNCLDLSDLKEYTVEYFVNELWYFLEYKEQYWGEVAREVLHRNLERFRGLLSEDMLDAIENYQTSDMINDILVALPNDLREEIDNQIDKDYQECEKEFYELLTELFTVCEEIVEEIPVKYGIPDWFDDKEKVLEDTNWSVEISGDDDGYAYTFETVSNAGENLVVFGDAETWDEVVKDIKNEYENADSDYAYEEFWDNRGKNGYPNGRDAIEAAIKARKESYKELYYAVMKGNK